MDPSTLDLLTALLSADPMARAMAIDGVVVLALPVAVQVVVSMLRRRPPNRRKGVPDGRLLAAWRWAYTSRKRLTKAVPLVLVVACVVVRFALAIAWDLSPVVETFRGLMVASSAVGLFEAWRAPGRVMATPPESGDARDR